MISEGDFESHLQQNLTTIIVRLQFENTKFRHSSCSQTLSNVKVANILLWLQHFELVQKPNSAYRGFEFDLDLKNEQFAYV